MTPSLRVGGAATTLVIAMIAVGDGCVDATFRNCNDPAVQCDGGAGTGGHGSPHPWARVRP